MAILNDDASLTLVIEEMLSFVVSGGRVESGRRGVVFRVVGEGERDYFNRNIQRVQNDVNARVGNLHGYRRLLDLEHLVHIWNRHAKPAGEQLHGQVPLNLEDFFLIPQIVQPGNLFECREVEGMQRLAYKKRWDHGNLIAVQELRARRRELATITLYKQK